MGNCHLHFATSGAEAKAFHAWSEGRRTCGSQIRAQAVKPVSASSPVASTGVWLLLHQLKISHTLLSTQCPHSIGIYLCISPSPRQCDCPHLESATVLQLDYPSIPVFAKWPLEEVEIKVSARQPQEVPFSTGQQGPVWAV